MKERDIIQDGLYIVSDKYFQDYRSDTLMKNKDNSRPTYFAFKDNDGVYWMIPLSSKVEKYRAKQAEYEQRLGTGNCVYYAFTKIAGREEAFLIGNMFPVSADYILRPYRISKIPYIVKNAKFLRDVQVKARKYLALLQNGTLNDTAKVLDTKSKLMK